MNTRIVLIDDHRIVRDGLRLVLRGEEGLEVVGEASDGGQALDLVERAKPDVAIVDMHLPGVSGLELLRCLRDRGSGVKLVVLSADADAELVEGAMQTGVSAYILKESASVELVRAIRAVVCGEAYLSSQVAAIVVEGYRRAVTAGSGSRVSVLSEREEEILRRIADGQSTKEVAYALGLSPKTVESHRSRLMEKLGLYTVAELTKHAIREGLSRL
ncbi:MAG: response regulator [Limisphaerales bacterium]|jgi:DNA-binding NarL/FixJ family response regulator